MKKAKPLWIAIFLVPMLIGCASVDKGFKEIANALAPRDIVTGKRTLNLQSESEEISLASNQTRQILEMLKRKGIGVDIDRETLSMLKDMMKRIAAVSHRPHLPWEIHLVESPEINAFTIGGGKIFVFRGLFGGLVDPSNKNELATVMAHEIAHVTAGHIGKDLARQWASSISQGAQREIGDKLFKASFSTLQEDEADRIGLLYMALAGYNPGSAAGVWLRAHQERGSHPTDYTYDHSLNIDRFGKVKKLVPIAMKYFRGQGIKNEDYDRLRVENDLVPRTSSFSGDSGLLALLEAGLGSYSDYLNAQNEKLQREAKIREGARLLHQLRVLNVRIANTADGYKGIFARLQNTGSQILRSAELTVYYYNPDGHVLYTDRVKIDLAYLQPGARREWGVYLKNVPGFSSIGAEVTKVES